MDNYSFLKTLNSELNESVVTESKKVKLTEGIDYAEYSVTMFDAKERTMFVPRRNAELFEAALESTTLLTDSVIKIILRKYNGVTEI